MAFRKACALLAWSSRLSKKAGRRGRGRDRASIIEDVLLLFDDLAGDLVFGLRIETSIDGESNRSIQHHDALSPNECD